MQFNSASSRNSDADRAIDEIFAAIPRRPVDLAVVFLTAQHRGRAIQIADRLRETLRPGALVGCTCEGVIGPDDEIEGAPGISILTADLPATVTPFHVLPAEWPPLLDDGDALKRK